MIFVDTYKTGITMTSNNIIRISQAISKTGLSRSTIYTLINRGEFPTRIKLSPRTVGFLESEVNDWIAQRLAASIAEG